MMAGGDEVDGTVARALPHGLFEITISDSRVVLAHFSDAVRLNAPRLVPGDRVWLRLSPYDAGRGRIVAHERAPRR
jgi:translation initiation factor IF-1